MQMPLLPGFQQKSTRSNVKTLARQNPSSVEFCFWPVERLSFLFYTQDMHIPMKQLHPVDFFRMVQQGPADCPMYFLLEGKGKRDIFWKAPLDS